MPSVEYLNRQDKRKGEDVVSERYWMTQDTDMNIARDILSSYYDREDELLGLDPIESAGFFRDVELEAIRVVPEGSVVVERAPWIIELEDTMECLHGEEKGEWIAARVLTLLMAEGESVH